MKMKKKIEALALFMGIFSIGNMIAQQKYDCLPCISTDLSLVDSTCEFHSDSLWNLKLHFTLTNCSSDSILVCDYALLDFKGGASEVYMEVFVKTKHGYKLFEPEEINDVQSVLLKNSMHLLPPQKSVTWGLSPRTYYRTMPPGEYKIMAVYQKYYIKDVETLYKSKYVYFKIIN